MASLEASAEQVAFAFERLGVTSTDELARIAANAKRDFETIRNSGTAGTGDNRRAFAASIILTGAALIREREHGTVEHLLVMPVTPGEIMFAKIWSMVLVVVCASFISLKFVIQGALEVPVQGSHALFFVGVVLHLFATASMGIYMATVARSMPRFGLLMIMTLIPLEMLSGGITPSESMPEIVQHLMQAAPTTHFVSLSKAILFRGAGIEVVWQSLMALLLIGIVLYILALGRFRKTINTME